MSDLVGAMVYTISSFVQMFFNLYIDDGVSIGGFLLAVAILGAVIRLIFSLINVPGSRWVSGGSSGSSSDVPRIERKE